MEITKKVGVYGDSILKGVQINPVNMRYHVDNHIDIDMISRENDIEIENFSKFGCTVTKAETIVTGNLEKGILCDTIIMDLGGNDCDFKWNEVAENPDAEHKPNTPIDIFAETYHKIIKMLKENNILPILTTLPPLEPQRFFDWFCKGLNKENVLKWLGSVNTIYRYQEMYSREVEKIACEENVPLVDLRGAFLKNFRVDNLLCEDGTHPNTEGQKVITSAFMDFTEKRKEMRKVLNERN